MIKAKLHLKNSYMGDWSEYNLQGSCNIQEIVKLKGHLQNTLISCLDHTGCEVCAKGKAGAWISLCSSCPSPLPSMKVVDNAHFGQKSEEQKLGHKALTSFIGDPSTLSIVSWSFLLILSCLCCFPPMCHALIFSLTLWSSPVWGGQAEGGLLRTSWGDAWHGCFGRWILSRQGDCPQGFGGVRGRRWCKSSPEKQPTQWGRVKRKGKKAQVRVEQEWKREIERRRPTDGGVQEDPAAIRKGYVEEVALYLSL